MATSNELFRLIKSLETNEKRHFKLLASTHSGDKNYIRLFDFLDSVELYDRQQIAEYFSEKAFMDNLTTTESYLYQKLLDGLRLYHQEKLTELKIYNLMAEAVILEQKGFYDLALDSLKKVRKIALEMHSYTSVLEVLKLQIRIMIALNQKQLTEQVDAFYTEALEIEKIISEEWELQRISHQLFTYTQKQRYHSSTEFKETLENLIQNELLNPSDLSRSFYAQFLRHQIWAYYYYLQQDFAKSIENYEQVMAIWDKHPNMKKKEARLYITNFANYINNNITQKEYEKAACLLAHLEKVSVDNFRDQAELFISFYFSKQYYLLNTNQFKEAADLSPAIEVGIEKYDSQILPNRKLSFCYNCAIAYLLCLDYENALRWLDRIINICRNDEARKDIQRFSRILQLVIFYMLESYEVLEHIFRSVYRNKAVKDQIHPFESTVLQHVKKLIQSPLPSAQKQAIWKPLLDALLKLEQEQKKITGFEEFVLWLRIITDTPILVE